ncbi:MAG: tetratricopeptide repeat protein [Deltaproteobacteria bacterium]|jgi:tetratricopeptide (TPR) repeat protein
MKRWALCLLLSACTTYRAQTFHAEADGTLPDDVEALLAMSDEAARWGPAGPDLQQSRAAAEHALTLEPENGEAAWRVARALFHLAQATDDAALAGRCIDVAELATKQVPDAAIAHYYASLCMGARAEAKTVEGLDLVERMLDEGKRALALDPTVLHGGPHRLLGGIYLRAPAWPASVGDLDAALEHLEAAIAIAPDWAENHLLLAEALHADDRDDEARAAVERARTLMVDPASEGWRDAWAEDLRRLEARMGTSAIRDRLLGEQGDREDREI